jgi:radical SAM-linked protein
VKVRLTVAKWGRLAYVGHLDTMRHLVRSLHRAGLTMRYTQGFHPKPKIESGPALPTGTAGLAELVDAWLIDPPPVDEIVARVRDATPADLELRAARVVEPGEKKLGRAIEGAEYVALVRGDRARIAAALDELLAAPTLIVERERKGRRRELDIRPYLRAAELLPARPAGLRLPRADDRAPISLVLELPGSGGARPSELLRCALGDAAADAWIVRTQLLLG